MTPTTIRCAEYDDPAAQCGACDSRMPRAGAYHWPRATIKTATRDGRPAWHVMVNGQFYCEFHTKAAAIAALARINRETAKG